MADYDIPDRVSKRLRYFNTQFLQEQDFIDEQKYHINRQRLHNQLLHTSGIAGSGLDVDAPQGRNKINVSPGVAIDEQGRMIVLASNREISIAPGTYAGKTVLVLISYPEPEQEDDPATAGGTGNTRWDETPNIELFPIGAGETDPPHLRLASVTFNSDGIIETSQHEGIIELGNGEDVVRYVVRSPEAGADVGNIVPQINSEDGVIDEKRIDSKIARESDVSDIKNLIDGHVNQTNNPHEVTPDLIEALPTAGGTIFGKLNVEANSPGTTGRPGAIFVHNSAGGNSCGVVAKITTTPTSAPNPRSTAVAGVSSVADVHGVYATARTDTYALYVDGKARITGELITNHLVDVFINASGQRLRTGDVVKLKGTPIPRFRGLNNTAPVAEVTLADQEDDTRVIGIVNCEAIPDSDTPDARVNPEDPTFIEDGGELFLVTLGAFAHCKVDATGTPIKVGDLLTSSNNPGHAKKATNPKLGSIIGKALEPLNQGTGYIAVFVNIQ